MKDGRIHDLRNGGAPNITVPTFDDAEPDEENTLAWDGRKIKPRPRRGFIFPA